MEINKAAPVVQKNEISINASPYKVWEILTNIKRWGEWNDRIKKPILQGDLRVGNTFVWNSGGSKITSEVHTYSPKKALGWTGKTFGATAIHNWYLEPITGGTLVKVEESMEGLVISLLKKKMNQKLANDMEFWLVQLKRESEK